jgi:hypothetical protein
MTEKSEEQSHCLHLFSPTSLPYEPVRGKLLGTDAFAVAFFHCLLIAVYSLALYSLHLNLHPSHLYGGNDEHPIHPNGSYTLKSPYIAPDTPLKANMSPESIPRFTLLSSPLKDLQKASSWQELGTTQLNGDEQYDGKTWWLDACDATAQDVNDVARCLSIHPLTVEDIVIQEPRQKIETFPNYYLISVRTLSTITDNGRSEMAEDTTQSPIPINPSMFYILVFSHGTVTFSTSGCEHASRVRNRISRLHDPSVLSSDWICYALLYVSRILPQKASSDIYVHVETT